MLKITWEESLLRGMRSIKRKEIKKALFERKYIYHNGLLPIGKS